MAMQAIGYGGQPARATFRPVLPPEAVLVDLTSLFPREPHGSGHYHPGGLQMYTVVEGRLSHWGLCEQGMWWGLVTYGISYGVSRKSVTHWIPAWMLRPRVGCDVSGHHRPRVGGGR